MPQQVITEMDTFFKAHSNDPVSHENIVWRGTPWGALHEKLIGRQMSPGTRFELDMDDEVRPWVELLETGQFSKETLDLTPLSYMVREEWLSILDLSGRLYGYTWLHNLHLGVARAEMGDVAGPRQLFQSSMDMKASPITARNLAVLSSDYQAAYNYFMTAWALARASTDPAKERLLLNLCAEICFFLQNLGWMDQLNQFLATVPPELNSTDQVLTSRVKVAIFHRDYITALDILANSCFPTYASDRIDLMRMWNTAQELRSEVTRGRKLTTTEAHQIRRQNPVPRNIGCPYGGFYCDNYW